MLRSPRPLALLAAGALAFAACGGDDASPATTGASPDTTLPDSTDAPDDGTGDDEEAADFSPGPVAIRVVNLLDEPVDVYVRTTGLVRAQLAEDGVAPGTVTERFTPPAEGRLVVTRAGAGDPECVGFCDHFVAEASVFTDEGPLRTLVLYEEDGTARAFEVWEEPGPDRMNSANSMQPADPDQGFVVALAVGLRDAAFGQRMSFVGVDGCQESFNLTGILVGGNQTPAFLYDGSSVEVLLHDNQDRECAEEPTGGPFTVTGGPGTRSLLVLTGTPGDMDAIVLPLGSGEVATPGPGPDDPDAAALDELVADFVASTGVDPDDGRCVITELVGVLGLDFFYDADGTLRGDDQITDDDIATLEAALDPALAACGVE